MDLFKFMAKVILAIEKTLPAASKFLAQWKR